MPLAVLLLLLLPLKDERPDAAEAAYEHALRLFHEGRNQEVQKEAAAGWARYQQSEPEWAGRFRLLDAQALIYLGKDGMYKQALDVLAGYSAPKEDALAGQVEKLSYEASALLKLGQLRAANKDLDDAEALCGKAQPLACGGMWLARGTLARDLAQMEKAQMLYPKADAYFQRAEMFYQRALDFARARKDAWRQANALMQLGYVGLLTERYDESVEWSRAGHELAARQGYEDVRQLTSGNLGVAWWKLGDNERALERYEEAQKGAAALGDLDSEQWWIGNEADVYRDRGTINHDRAQMLHAEELHERLLGLARQAGDSEQIVDALFNVALLELYTDKLDRADEHLHEALQMEAAAKHAPPPFLVLLDGEVATAKHDYAKGEQDYLALLSSASSQVADQINAGNSLGRLYEAQGKYAQAERMYKSTIARWAAARAQLKHEESALPFGTSSSQVYRNYVRFLVKRGRSAEALAIADQSRAKTLTEGLGMAAKSLDGKEAMVRPEEIARKTGATLLFYWLDKDESYLWAITPGKTALFTLPGEVEIVSHVQSYRNAILDLRDPLERGNADGKFLYQSLVAPAWGMVDAKKPVIVLADGALNELNFETLPVPEATGKAHALIEDWTLESAPSLDLLAAGKDAKTDGERKMLLVGNPVTEDPKFPALAYFGTEMKRVAGHFDAGSVDVISGARATPAAYLDAKPEEYEFIHFVSHATASRTSPLDSAILLSAPAPALALASALASASASASAASGDGGVKAFRLYGREIVAHPLTARLVTISACDGAGTRAYAGEGLVGLSWAFLRAGARQVVASLWEVSDNSTPKLMDDLYAGIAAGKTPAEALREAKLSLLHTQERGMTRFRQPFYWAAFQIYSRE